MWSSKNLQPRLRKLMWHAPEGETTFSGPYGLMLASGIRSLLDELIMSTQFDDPYELGCKVFDSMTEEQKAWTLHKVAFGLLDEKIPVCKLHAYLEATIAGVFLQLHLNGCSGKNRPKNRGSTGKTWVSSTKSAPNTIFHGGLDNNRVL